MISKINLNDELNNLEELYIYKKIGKLNGNVLSVVNVADRTLDFHVHESSDELFYVVEGLFWLETDSGLTEVGEGEFVIVPANDMNTWPMAQTFYYYTQLAPTSYTVNVLMDVTKMRKALKARRYKFFPAYLYLVTRVINEQMQFRIGVKEGEVGYWNTLVPAYPQFHDDDKTTSLLWTEYENKFQDFHDHYIKDTRMYGNSHGILSAKGAPPANSYIISCIPWFTFQSFSLHNHGIKDYYYPSFEAGGFTETSGRIQMPLSVTVHHAVADGYHLKVFFEELQRLINQPEEWL